MKRTIIFILGAFILMAGSPAVPVCAADQEVFRGEVKVAVESPTGAYMDEKIPPPADKLRREALEETAYYYGGMIYGWSFHYDIGERARGIGESFTMEPLGEIRWGDPALKPTAAGFDGGRFRLESGYYLDEAQRGRAAVWKKGETLSMQGLGSGVLADIIRIGPGVPPEPPPAATWLDLKKAALKDAARSALRAYLRGRERNRPKEVSGFIGLAAFPRYVNQSGRLSAAARFYVDIKKIVPFAAY